MDLCQSAVLKSPQALFQMTRLTGRSEKVDCPGSSIPLHCESFSPALPLRNEGPASAVVRREGQTVNVRITGSRAMGGAFTARPKSGNMDMICS
jgi:hypothetical protein